MKKIHILQCLMLTTQVALSQDYVVTWKDDTLHCRLPEKPGKEGIRPAMKYENGHIRFLAIFPNDSIRVLEAGQVKGYYRQKHGRYLLCDGVFEAKKFAWPRRDTNWYFMSRVAEGKFATLYRIYLKTSKQPVLYYFLSKAGYIDTMVPVLVKNWRHLRQLLTEDKMKEEVNWLFEGSKKRKFIEVVKAYNQLKQDQRYAVH